MLNHQLHRPLTTVFVHIEPVGDFDLLYRGSGQTARSTLKAMASSSTTRWRKKHQFQVFSPTSRWLTIWNTPSNTGSGKCWPQGPANHRAVANQLEICLRQLAVRIQYRLQFHVLGVTSDLLDKCPGKRLVILRGETEAGGHGVAARIC